jgi:hypothetical protein
MATITEIDVHFVKKYLLKAHFAAPKATRPSRPTFLFPGPSELVARARNEG